MSILHNANLEILTVYSASHGKALHVQCILKIVARILAMILTVFRASRTYYENRVARNATRERGGTYF